MACLQAPQGGIGVVVGTFKDPAQMAIILILESGNWEPA